MIKMAVFVMASRLPVAIAMRSVLVTGRPAVLETMATVVLVTVTGTATVSVAVYRWYVAIAYVAVAEVAFMVT